MTRKQLVFASRTSAPKFDPNEPRSVRRMIHRMLDNDDRAFGAPDLLRDAERAARRARRKRG